MARCLSCNKNLNDFESTRRHAVSLTFIDLCNGCYTWVKHDVPVTERADLAKEESIETDLEEFNYDESSN